MSSRNFRKVVGSTLPPPDSDDSDAEYDPAAIRYRPTQTYAGLLLSDDDESDPNPETDNEDDKQDEAAACTPGTGAFKRKQKKDKRKKGQNGDVDIAGSSSNVAAHTSERRGRRRNTSRANNIEIDEIARSVMEVNKLLGEPPPAPEPPRVEELDEARIVLKVEAKHLNVAHELKRLFGPEDPEEVRQRNKTQPHRVRILKRIAVAPTHDTRIYDYKKRGLSMSIDRREGNITYFVYNHDREHQRMHNLFLTNYANSIIRPGSARLNLEEATRNMHVEPMLHIADTLFGVDENSLGNELVENVVTYLQYVAHPSFNLTSRNVRLSYDYIENRPFHVVMLKYMYLLSNKACHRTALEIGKMLLNIDPTDPLATLLIIDTIALRAREHEWLIELVDYFETQRRVKMLHNMSYSYALAHFHVANKKKKDLAEADKHLKEAIICFPRILTRLLEYANVSEPAIQTHVLFAKDDVHTNVLSELMTIYAKLTWSRWREPEVMEWLIRNAKEVIALHDNDGDTKERVNKQAMLRRTLFQVWPPEVMRHVSVIRTMSNLLLEMTLTPSTRPTSAWDPLFEPGINRYSYKTPGDQARPAPSTGGRALLYRFFTSILPSTELDPPID